MGNVVVVAAVVVLVTGAVLVVLRNSHGIVAKRGLSIGADLAGMGDAPRVRVRAVTISGPGRVRLILMPVPDPPGPPGPSGEPPGAADMDVTVKLDEQEFGFGLLRAWQRAQSPLAMVLPPGGRLVRLRSVDDLQHLTLRRVDKE